MFCHLNLFGWLCWNSYSVIVFFPFGCFSKGRRNYYCPLQGGRLRRVLKGNFYEHRRTEMGATVLRRRAVLFGHFVRIHHKI